VDEVVVVVVVVATGMVLPVFSIQVLQPKPLLMKTMQKILLWVHTWEVTSAL
jgi:hypothetical protein